MPMLRKQALALIPNLPQRLENEKHPARRMDQIGYLAPLLVSVLVYVMLISMPCARCFLLIESKTAVRLPTARPNAITTSIPLAPTPAATLPTFAFFLQLLNRHALFHYQRLKPYSFAGLP